MQAIEDGLVVVAYAYDSPTDDLWWFRALYDDVHYSLPADLGYGALVPTNDAVAVSLSTPLGDFMQLFNSAGAASPAIGVPRHVELNHWDAKHVWYTAWSPFEPSSLLRAAHVERSDL